MEETEKQEFPREEEKTGYEPRPAWQVWGARIGVVVMLLAFIAYCWQIATGGLG